MTLAPPRTEFEFLSDIEADAIAYGGPDWLAQSREEAAGQAREFDFLARRSVYLGVLWQLVDARRAELVGELVPTPDGRWREVTPARCPRGHPFAVRGGWSSSWIPCSGPGHHGHQSFYCRIRTDDGTEDGTECGAQALHPEPVEGCRFAGIG